MTAPSSAQPRGRGHVDAAARGATETGAISVPPAVGIDQTVEFDVEVEVGELVTEGKDGSVGHATWRTNCGAPRGVRLASGKVANLFGLAANSGAALFTNKGKCIAVHRNVGLGMSFCDATREVTLVAIKGGLFVVRGVGLASVSLA